MGCEPTVTSLPRVSDRPRACVAGADRPLLGHQQGLIVGWATGLEPDHPQTESGMQLRFRAGYLDADHATLTLAVCTDMRTDTSAFTRARSGPLTLGGTAARYRNFSDRVRSAAVLRSFEAASTAAD